MLILPLSPCWPIESVAGNLETLNLTIQGYPFYKSMWAASKLALKLTIAFNYYVRPYLAVPSDIMASNRTSIAWAHVEDWNKHRIVITELYLDQKTKLEGVRRIMTEEYGFCATLRM
ncbi:hypothetical protein F4860DRAFT_165370 [Xylaria cubensis]|nr:hypothetical protein F4860DRAFT_165370 [Xylaria cubensis]